MNIELKSFQFQARWRHILLLSEGFPVTDAREWLLDNIGERWFEISLVNVMASDGSARHVFGWFIGFLSDDDAARFKLFWC